MKINKWNIDHRYSGSSHNLDVFYRRKIFRIGYFHLWESIRIIQEKTSDDVSFRYYRVFGMNAGKYNKKMPNKIRRMLNSIFSKSIEIGEVRNTKYIKKYPFVGELFKEERRNKILEELGI